MTNMTGESKTRVLVAHLEPLLVAGRASVLNAGNEFQAIVVERHVPLCLRRDCWPMTDVAVVDYEAGIELIRTSNRLRRVVILTHDDREARVRAAIEAGVRGYVLTGCAES